MKGTVEGLRALIRAGALGSLEDGELLDRFVATGEPAAFEVIVRRHGPMVWGVCRRALRDHHDAEDAFQATFLVLARRAEVVRPRDRLVAWLYGVARRTALKARADRARRRLREGSGEPPEPSSTPAEPRAILAESLDRELARLPEKYRLPIVLCDLEGRAHREAAEHLGWPIGTLSGRHSRARALLADRLRRRGAALPAAALLALSADEASAAPIAKALACAGRTTTVSSTVLALATNVQGGLLMTRIKTIAAAAALTAAAGMGVIGFAQDQPPAPPLAPEAPAPPPAEAKAEDALIVRAYYVGDFIGADPGRAPTAGELRPVIDLVAAAIAPGTWGGGDGPGPFIAPHPVAASLLVRHDRATQDRVNILFRHLRRVLEARDGARRPRPVDSPPAPLKPAVRPEEPRADEARPAAGLVHRVHPIGDLVGIDTGPPGDPDAIPDGAWSLANRIADEIAPESWIPRGGSGWFQPCYARAAEPSTGDRPDHVDPNRKFLALGVRQTPEIQALVKRRLDDLRDARVLRTPAP